jgi:hypothetical protein
VCVGSGSGQRPCFCVGVLFCFVLWRKRFASLCPFLGFVCCVFGSLSRLIIFLSFLQVTRRLFSSRESAFIPLASVAFIIALVECTQFWGAESMVERVICVNRKRQEVAVSLSIQSALLQWIKRSETLYLIIVLFFVYCVDVGLDRFTHYCISTAIVAVVLLWDEKFRFFSKLSALKTIKSSPKKAKQTDRSELQRRQQERTGIRLDQCRFGVRKIRIINENEKFVDFTEYPHAKSSRSGSSMAVYCVEFVHGCYCWSVWRTLSQFQFIRRELLMKFESDRNIFVPLLSPPDIPEDDIASLPEQYVSQCQLAIMQWLQQAIAIPSLSNDASFREFLCMDPYQKLENSPMPPTPSAAGSPTSKYDKGKFWEGTSIDDVTFLDETDARRNLYIDCSYSHNFKIRGPTYLTDKRKIDAGSPICKMIMLEMIEAAPEDGGRIDNISSRGVVKERIKVINR